MSWDDYINPEIIQNPIYWPLTVGAEIALLIGFKAQGLWGSDGIGMSLPSKIGVLALVPIISYFIVMKIGGK